MSVKRTILKGTLILTLTGFATRFMGFFYRIFLSHTFGEEGVGLYQLIFPVYALCFSLTSAGIETADASQKEFPSAESGRRKHFSSQASCFPSAHPASSLYFCRDMPGSLPLPF